MSQAAERLEALLKALNPDPKLDKQVWVGKNVSKRDLCDTLALILIELKGGCDEQTGN